MRRDVMTWRVAQEGIRPAGKPDRCFYCNEPLGAVHLPSCVIRQRTVVIKATIELTVTVPEHWDVSMINFHRNDSTSCSDNFVDELQARAQHSEKASCICAQSSFEYLREATADDEERDGIRVADVKS